MLTLSIKELESSKNSNTYCIFEEMFHNKDKYLCWVIDFSCLGENTGKCVSLLVHFLETEVKIDKKTKAKSHREFEYYAKFFGSCPFYVNFFIKFVSNLSKKLYQKNVIIVTVLLKSYEKVDNTLLNYIRQNVKNFFQVKFY